MAATAYHPDVRAELPDVITCISEGDDPRGRRRQGVSRPDDAPVGPAQGCEPGATARETRPLVQTGQPVCEPHDSTGEPGAGDRHAGFGERGEETCPRDSDCGPARKRRMEPPSPTGYAPPLDSTRYGHAAGPTGRWRCRRPAPVDVPCARRAPGPDRLAVRRCLSDCRNAGYRLDRTLTYGPLQIGRARPVRRPLTTPPSQSARAGSRVNSTRGLDP